MKDNFDEALTHVLKHEGGYVNHPRDPGGATNKGVTQATYNAYRKSRAKLSRSVKHITWDEIKDIYKSRFWDKVRGDDLPSGLDYAVFDFGVNSGPDRAIRFLQAAVKTTVDGKFGPKTLAAIEGVGPAAIDRLMDRRLAFLKRLRTWRTFGRGWNRRVTEVRSFAHTLAKRKV